jgi:TRAP-type C4-dicarboxylate transport system permease small subunit
LLVKALEITVILVTTILVIDVLWGVFSRYIMEEQSAWTEELARMLLIWVSLLGASVGFMRKSHLGVDYFVGKLSPKAQIIVQIIVYLLVITFVSCAMIYGGITLISSTLEKGQLLQTLRFEKGYVYLALPISGFFIVIFSIETIIKNIISLFRKPSPE